MAERSPRPAKRGRSFKFDEDVLAWLDRTAAEQRTNVNALANKILADAMNRARMDERDVEQG